jgi:hypothetical protein
MDPWARLLLLGVRDPASSLHALRSVARDLLPIIFGLVVKANVDFYAPFIEIDEAFSDHEFENENEEWGGPCSLEELWIPAEAWPREPVPEADCNMLPFRMVAGEVDEASLPAQYHPMLAVVRGLRVENHEAVCYLTVDQRPAVPGQPQRRAGLHVERLGLREPGGAVREYGAHWGHGQCLGGSRSGGIYMASDRPDSVQLWACRV